VNLCHSHHRRSGVEDRWRDRQAPAAPALPPDLDEMWALVQALPTRQREVLVLRFYLDLRVADVADLLDVPVGTVKSAIHRGLAALSTEVAP
jgi:DNA-directed RNA polymerase specialized sigma24 family protein